MAVSWIPLAPGEAPAWLAGVARALNPEAKVVVRTRYHSDGGDLKAAIIRSAEPGETFGHCFADDLRLEPVRTPARAKR